MTVEELLDELKQMPPDATIVFRHNRDDVPSEYTTVDVFYADGEAYIDIHDGEDDEASDDE